MSTPTISPTRSYKRIFDYLSCQDFSFKQSLKRYSICWRRERSKCSLCFSAGLFGLSNVPSAVKPSPSSSSTSPWTKKAGYTDSICCSKDNPVANCGTSGDRYNLPLAQIY